MKLRGRECEEAVPLEYLIKLDHMHDAYIEFISKTVKVHIVDGNKDQEDVFNEVMNILNVII
jgi:thymidylate kinase